MSSLVGMKVEGDSKFCMNWYTMAIDDKSDDDAGSV